jgi:drug/metabolite transporter (DMT)-like permease
MINSLFLYILTSLIWGSTWYAIQFQLNNVSPTWSVVYRFTIASSLLITFCLLRKESLKFDLRSHIGMATQGLLLFCLNYIFFYFGSDYLISGIVAVLSASMQIVNIINSRIFFKVPLKLSIMFSAIIGISGLILVFCSQASKLYLYHATNYAQQLIGLVFCLIGVLCASWGNMASAYNQQQKLPILQSNAFGMFYGALFATIIAIILGEKPTISFTFPYISSLLYLAIFGSIIAFGAYLKLLGQIGPGRAAYMFVITPIIALIISSFFEGFQWHIFTVIGMILIIIGNILALYKPEMKLITRDTIQVNDNNNSLKFEQK